MKVRLTLLALLVNSSVVNAADVTEIRYGIWDRNQLPVIETIVERFEEKNPDINVAIELTPYKQYFVKLNAAASGGSMPDVFWMNMPNFITYTKHGLLSPMDKYLENSPLDINDFVSSSVSAYQYKGKQYGVPRDIDSIAVWYNKDLFDKAGVSYPTNSWSWSDMEQKATAIQKKLDDNIFPIMMNLTDGQETYYNLILQSGAYVTSDDKRTTEVGSANAIKAYKRVQSLMERNLLPSAQKISELNSGEVFQSGRAAMVYAGSWNALPFSNNEKINDHIGVVTMPKMERSAGVSHSLAYAVSAKTKNMDASWRLVEFLGSDESQAILARSKTVIPAKKTVSDQWAASFTSVDVSAYTVALESAFQYPTAGNSAKWQSLLNDGLKKVWLGKDPEKVMPKVEKRIQRVLDKG